MQSPHRTASNSHGFSRQRCPCGHVCPQTVGRPAFFLAPMALNRPQNESTRPGTPHLEQIMPSTLIPVYPIYETATDNQTYTSPIFGSAESPAFEEDTACSSEPTPDPYSCDNGQESTETVEDSPEFWGTLNNTLEKNSKIPMVQNDFLDWDTNWNAETLFLAGPDINLTTSEFAEGDQDRLVLL
ncbi:hypothetical protein ABW19_dt0205848 [Dactylella cylindrospora]|nr:hypothetical protein ABW19_dt0205848 [Dactylella cylindrospora]